jgi:hypothetical protein
VENEREASLLPLLRAFEGATNDIDQYPRIEAWVLVEQSLDIVTRPRCVSGSHARGYLSCLSPCKLNIVRDLGATVWGAIRYGGLQVVCAGCR